MSNMNKDSNKNETKNEVKKETQALLSTIDNPYNPFKDFDAWYAYDTFRGYNSCSLMSRFMDENFDPYLLATHETECQIMAIDEIVKNDLTGLRIKVEEVVSLETY